MAGISSFIQWVRLFYESQFQRWNLGPESHVDHLLYWRGRILFAIYFCIVFLGIFALIPSVYISYLSKEWLILAVDVLGYGCLIGILFSRSCSFPTRALFLTFLIFIIGIILMYSVNAVFSLIWFFAATLICAVLFGFQAALIVIGINAIILASAGYFIRTGYVNWIGNADYSTLGWAIVTINFILLNFICSVSIAVLVERLRSTLQKEIDLSEGLMLEKQKYLSEWKQRSKAEKERSLLETKLQQARKMEAIGLLAGGVAHDLNNILSGIINYPELLLLKLPEDSPLRSSLMAIRDSGTRAAEVVSDLLTVARGVASIKKPADLNELVDHYFETAEFRSLRDHYSEIEFSFIPMPIQPIACSNVHINKVIMNLVTNAAEAIGDKQGWVKLKTKLVQIGKSDQSVNYIPEGTYCQLSIHDSGCGIPPSARERIFEPFYSKKTLGRSGTGLGLAISWNTIHEHGGTITVENPETGTIFHVFLPVTEDPLVGLDGQLDSAPLMGKGQKILVVDDEEVQRDICHQMLTQLNYQVETKPSGHDAIEFLRSNHADLVVLDMIMDPGLSGFETFLSIRDMNPNQKTILISGFSKTDDVNRALEAGVSHFLKKPYDMKGLSHTVHEALNGENTQPPPQWDLN